MNKFFESDVLDDAGNVVISTGLKVRHKDSQFEYTVDSVLQDEDGVKVVLQLPEQPRFKPEESAPKVLDSVGKSKMSGVIYEIDPNALYFEPEDHDDADTIVVPQEEFEKDYEVR